MKIIAKTETGWLIEATAEEIQQVGSIGSTGHGPVFRIGAEIVPFDIKQWAKRDNAAHEKIVACRERISAACLLIDKAIDEVLSLPYGKPITGGEASENKEA